MTSDRVIHQERAALEDVLGHIVPFIAAMPEDCMGSHFEPGTGELLWHYRDEWLNRAAEVLRWEQYECACGRRWLGPDDSAICPECAVDCAGDPVDDPTHPPEPEHNDRLNGPARAIRDDG